MLANDQFNESLETDSVPVSPPEVIALEEADDILETLSSKMRRTILNILCEEPTNVAKLAEQLETSNQNVLYHIRELRAAGLVQIVGTNYSAKGREMNLYAPACTTIVIDIFEPSSENQNDQSGASQTGAHPNETTSPITLTDG